ncbi:dienelactone hydrolase family protein [Streptomyces sp. AS02]|uniref:dienelactone hydrolase family protein n=1 Tax=Streptomyces sp. AS02 TaxID=2938946 RepID=UPI0020203030|nr:dienelactone hydrolase family protein [Streptomyces sp. AS02]MCL8010189.1 dienelactone hydrolase family protein [Streptomyces sp. AS02]
MTSVQATDVDVPTEDGVADAYLAHPGDGLPRPGVLLYQDAFGLRPHLRSMADRLAEAGYTVLVPNVFYRHGRSPVFELPEFIDPAARPELWEKIVPVMQSLTPELAMRDAGAYLRWMAQRPEVADGPVALTGYCMGARLALRTAGAYPERVAAAAGFHGGQLATDAPDSPHLVAEHVTAELYFGHADADHSMPPEQMERLAGALTAAGVRHRYEVYEGAHHGYTQADTSAYDRAAAERHWAALLDLLKRTF